MTIQTVGHIPGALPADLPEAVFQTTVIAAARWYRWRVNHQRPAMVRASRGGARYVTATTGDVGMPDLVLAKTGRVIVAELKTRGGRLRPAQQEWLDALGPHGRLWRPADWPAILTELSAA